MIIEVQDRTTAPFKAAHAIFSKATLARRCSLPEPDQEAVEDLIAPLFEAMLHTPVVSLDDLTAKVEAIISEYGQGDCIPSRMVTALIADITKLAGANPLD